MRLTLLILHHSCEQRQVYFTAVHRGETELSFGDAVLYIRNNCVEVNGLLLFSMRGEENFDSFILLSLLLACKGGEQVRVLISRSIISGGGTRSGLAWLLRFGSRGCNRGLFGGTG